MRKSTRAAVLAASLLVAVGILGLALAACGGSSAADAQAQAAPSGMPQPNGQTGDSSALIAQQLEALVKDGTITSAQQTAAVAAIKASMPGVSGGAPQAAPSPGAQPTPGAQPAERGAMFATALDTLVEKGTITAEQEKAIEAALKQGMPNAAPGAQQSSGGSSV